jgi:hypothetical protein
MSRSAPHPRRLAQRLVIAACLVLGSAPAVAQDVLIRGATVHTASARGTLQNADVLVQGGTIRAVGSGNIGATNVFRILGKPAGILVLLSAYIVTVVTAKE